MLQNEFLCGVIAQHTGSVSLLGFVERVQISTVQGGNNGVAQVGENLAKAERQPATSLEQVVWQAAQVAGRGVQYDHQIRLLTLVPAGTKLRFVGIPKGDMILERNQFKAPLAYARKNAFFQKKPVGVGN